MLDMGFDNEPAQEVVFGGVYRGIVVSTNDPERRNRIIVRVPAVNGDGDLDWAMPAAPVGGALALPAVGAPVWVMFEHGHVEAPVRIGSWLDVNHTVAPTPTTTTLSHFVYYQRSSASTWTVVHNLGYDPVVAVIRDDPVTNVVGFDLSYSVDHNSLTLGFSEAITGRAILSN